MNVEQLKEILQPALDERKSGKNWSEEKATELANQLAGMVSEELATTITPSGLERAYKAFWQEAVNTYLTSKNMEMQFRQSEAAVEQIEDAGLGAL